MTDYGMEMEALASERFEADMEQAELEAAGREHHRRVKLSGILRSLGRWSQAAKVCPHGHGNSRTFECYECGSLFDRDPFDRGARIVDPCAKKRLTPEAVRENQRHLTHRARLNRTCGACNGLIEAGAIYRQEPSHADPWQTRKLCAGCVRGICGGLDPIVPTAFQAAPER